MVAAVTPDGYSIWGKSCKITLLAAMALWATCSRIIYLVTNRKTKTPPDHVKWEEPESGPVSERMVAMAPI